MSILQKMQMQKGPSVRISELNYDPHILGMNHLPKKAIKGQNVLFAQRFELASPLLGGGGQNGRLNAGSWKVSCLSKI